MKATDFLDEYQKRLLFYAPTPKQKDFHNASSTAFEMLFVGGNGSGKTTCGRMCVAMHAMGVYPSWYTGLEFSGDIIIWVIGPSLKVTRDNLQVPLVGDKHIPGIIHKDLLLEVALARGIKDSLDFVKVLRKDGGIATIRFLSCDQRIENLQSQRVNLIYIDEESPYDKYREFVARTFAVKQRLVLITTSPLKGLTEMMTYFFKDPLLVEGSVGSNQKYYIRVECDDNPYFSEEQKAQQRATMKPWEIEARLKGIPTVGTGLIYCFPESAFVITPFEIPEHWARFYGLDVGWVAPTAAVFFAHDRDNDVIYVVGEYSATERTPSQHAYHLSQMGADWMPGACDPAADSANQLSGESVYEHYTERKYGINFNLMKSSSKKKEFVFTEIYDRIRTGRYKVFSTCTKFLGEWRMYSRDKEGRIIKGNDHLMNANEYGMLDGIAQATTMKHLQAIQSYQSPVNYF